MQLTREQALDISDSVHDAIQRERGIREAARAPFDPMAHGWAMSIEKAIGIMPLFHQFGISAALTVKDMEKGGGECWIIDLRWSRSHALPPMEPLRLAHENLAVLLCEAFIMACHRRRDDVEKMIIA